jgi:hypothetical protein
VRERKSVCKPLTLFSKMKDKKKMSRREETERMYTYMRKKEAKSAIKGYTSNIISIMT